MATDPLERVATISSESTLKEDSPLRFERVRLPGRKPAPLSRLIIGFGHWLTNDEGVFALRILTATMIISVLAVTNRTPGFFYREKGLWGLIMAQSGMAAQSADFIFGFVSRLIATVVGGVIGMVAWYIGSGSGSGNPYGLSAVTAVVSLLVMAVRLWTRPRHMGAVVMGSSTAVLLVGYGFLDTHNPTYGNPGYGYELFWRRTLLVMTGFTVAFLVSLLPWPKSQTRFIATQLSDVLDTQTDHYASLYASWGVLDKEAKEVSSVEKTAIDVTGALAALDIPIANLRFELSSFQIDRAALIAVQHECTMIDRNLARLHTIATGLPAHNRERLAAVTGMLHQRQIADIMVVLSVIKECLKTGDPLPSILPTPLVNRSIEHSEGTEMSPMTAETLEDESYRRSLVASGAYLSFLSSIDRLVLILKGVVGQAHCILYDAELA